MRRPRSEALLVAALALLVRVALVLWARSRFPPAEDGHYYDVLARRIAGGAGYTWLWPDGAVTYVAHYPVGYPAIVAAGYALFGRSPTVAMALNAVLGAASTYGVHRLVDHGGGGAGSGGREPVGTGRRALAASLVVALHPALVPYTAALMTEGVTASLLVVAAALCMSARRRACAEQEGRIRLAGWLVAAGVAMGLATLVRPQCLVLAPAFGALAVPPGRPLRARFAAAALVVAGAIACVAPWTARNCVRMHRCALVSVNGGWNLLIGATTENGAWHAVPVPSECATVWDEAGKDVCFEHAAWRSIEGSPLAWAGRAPAKLAATFDYFGAGPWYLHASNGQAFGDRAKTVLGAVETLACRLLLLGALVAAARMEGARAAARKAVALGGAIAALTIHGWIGYAAVPVIALVSGPRAIARGPVALPMAAVVIAATGAIHAVFFGAGRYGLVVAPFVAALAFARSSGCEGAPRGAHWPASTPLGRSPAAPPVRREESPSSTEHDAG